MRSTVAVGGGRSPLAFGNMSVPGVLLLFALTVAAIGLLFWKRTRIFGGVVLVCVVAFSTVRVAAEHGWQKAFDSLPDGASEADLMAVIRWHTFEFEDGKCPMGYSLHDHDPRVGKEIWCVQFFFPGQFAFGFDAGGKLVSRHHYQSP